MARRKQAKRDTTVKRNEYIVRSDHPLVSREARRTKAQCNICGRYIEKGMLRSHVRQVHKSKAPQLRLQEIRDDPALAVLRGYALSKSPHEVDRDQWDTLTAYIQEVQWLAKCHAAQLDPKVLAEVQRILRWVERAFTDGWIRIGRPPKGRTNENDFLEPPEYKSPFVHIVRGGLPGSGRRS